MFTSNRFRGKDKILARGYEGEKRGCTWLRRARRRSRTPGGRDKPGGLGLDPNPPREPECKTLIVGYNDEDDIQPSWTGADLRGSQGSMEPSELRRGCQRVSGTIWNPLGTEGNIPDWTRIFYAYKNEVLPKMYGDDNYETSVFRNRVYFY